MNGLATQLYQRRDKSDRQQSVQRQSDQPDIVTGEEDRDIQDGHKKIFIFLHFYDFEDALIILNVLFTKRVIRHCVTTSIVNGIE